MWGSPSGVLDCHLLSDLDTHTGHPGKASLTDWACLIALLPMDVANKSVWSESGYIGLGCAGERWTMLSNLIVQCTDVGWSSLSSNRIIERIALIAETGCRAVQMQDKVMRCGLDVGRFRAAAISAAIVLWVNLGILGTKTVIIGPYSHFFSNFFSQAKAPHGFEPWLIIVGWGFLKHAAKVLSRRALKDNNKTQFIDSCYT